MVGGGVEGRGCFLSGTLTGGGWPLAAAGVARRPGELSELTPTSGKGFCRRSHCKVRRVGGGRRIPTLLVAHIVCSSTIAGHSVIWGTCRSRRQLWGRLGFYLGCYAIVGREGHTKFLRFFALFFSRFVYEANQRVNQFLC